MITVNVQGHGSFVVPSEKINELLQWLNSHSLPNENNSGKIGDNETLLNG